MRRCVIGIVVMCLPGLVAAGAEPTPSAASAAATPSPAAPTPFSTTPPPLVSDRPPESFTEPDVVSDPRWFAEFDVLAWKLDNAPAPPIVSFKANGVLTIPATTSILTQSGATQSVTPIPHEVPVSVSAMPPQPSGASFDTGTHGGRITFGYVPTVDECLGYEILYSQIEQRSVFFTDRQAGSISPVNTGLNDTMAVQSLFVAPGSGVAPATQTSTPVLQFGTSQSQTLGSASSAFLGGEVLARMKVLYWDLSGFDFLFGIRYMDLSESFTTTGATRIILTQPGTAVFQAASYDSVHTQNRFYGGEIGLAYRLDLGPLAVKAVGKLAIGDVDQQADVFTSGIGTSDLGGRLGSPDVNGRRSLGRLAFIPEAGVNVGWQITPSWNVHIGYDFLSLNSVARPGSLFGETTTATTVTVNGNPVNTTFRQLLFLFKDSDVVIQGLNFGAEFRF